MVEVLAGDKTPAQIARAYGMRPDSVRPWKRRFIERAPEAFAGETTANRSVVSGIRNSRWAGRKWRSRFQKIAWAGTTERGGESGDPGTGLALIRLRRFQGFGREARKQTTTTRWTLYGSPRPNWGVLLFRVLGMSCVWSESL
ncbi:MAG: hypothetical protein F4X36_07440 [Gammaproteobacteria bacterium]|nr:hypothetical protein [Gammaproteobacteria bacterium]